MSQQDMFQNEFDQKFGQAYREGRTQPTNSENTFDTIIPTPTPAQQLARQAAPESTAQRLLFGFEVTDFINALLPHGTPERLTGTGVSQSSYLIPAPSSRAKSS